MSIPESLAANRWQFVSRDMDEVIDFLLAAECVERVGNVLDTGTHARTQEAFLKASMVAYARGFLRSKSEGHADALADVNELGLTAAQRSLHDRIIELRKRAVAHADWTYHNTEVVTVRERGIGRRSSAVVAWQEIGRNAFKDLAQEMFRLASVRSYALSLRAAGQPADPSIPEHLSDGLQQRLRT